MSRLQKTALQEKNSLIPIKNLQSYAISYFLNAYNLKNGKKIFNFKKAVLI